MKKLILIAKGFIVGTANIVPGVSGGTMLMSLGIFENIIFSLNHFFKDIKKNLDFLIPIIIGMLLSVIVMSRVISFALDKYAVITIMFFIGLILGSFPMLLNNIKNKERKISYNIAFVIPFLIVTILAISDINNGLVKGIELGTIECLKIFLLGILSASAMIIPGLSGSFMLMLFGYYENIMNVIKDFTSLNNIISNGLILFVFGIGILLGLYMTIKIISYLLDKYEVGTYYAIIGFVSASIISIFTSNLSQISNSNIISVIFSIVFLISGILLSYKLGEKN